MITTQRKDAINYLVIRKKTIFKSLQQNANGPHNLKAVSRRDLPSLGLIHQKDICRKLFRQDNGFALTDIKTIIFYYLDIPGIGNFFNLNKIGTSQNGDFILVIGIARQLFEYSERNAHTAKKAVQQLQPIHFQQRNNRGRIGNNNHSFFFAAE